MTREEAIKRLKLTDACDSELCEALEMAIKALEQEPCEDCISRQAVLAIAGDSCLDLDSYEDTREFCDEIKELPSVTPQQKMGRWIYTGDHLTDGMLECSVCGKKIDVSERCNYCGNCGSYNGGDANVNDK